MVRVQEADLASDSKCLLLVEGIDDWHSLYHLVIGVRQREPRFDIGYCGNDDAVLEMLGSVIAGSGNTKTVLGAVLDADPDTGVAGRLQAIRRILGVAYDIPETFPVGGLIATPKDTRPDRDRLPKIGVWLMPDNERDGIFEDLLCCAIAPKSETYISAVIDKAKDDGKAAFREVERSKAIVKTHIAWQDPKKKNLGEAIGSHFENLAPACAPFLKWLEALFNLGSEEGVSL